MAEKRLTVGASVVVEVEVRWTSSWSLTTTMDQIIRQAKVDAEGALNKILAGEKVEPGLIRKTKPFRVKAWVVEESEE